MTFHSQWLQRPIRTCHTLRVCQLCPHGIRSGQQYHDGGFARRAHVECVDRLDDNPAKEANP
jgi:hypothetical protein